MVYDVSMFSRCNIRHDLCDSRWLFLDEKWESSAKDVTMPALCRKAEV
jgi:hypothetical protein